MRSKGIFNAISLQTANGYFSLILNHPMVVLAVCVGVLVLSTVHVPSFRLDASADALVLENDADLRYYDVIRKRYGSDDFLIITYTPKDDLFSDEVLADIQRLKTSLEAMENVATVVSVLDAPLVQSPPVTIAQMGREVLTLNHPKAQRELARTEIVSSPLYRNLLVSPDGKTTALQVIFVRNETWHALLAERNAWNDAKRERELSPDEEAERRAVSLEFDELTMALQNRQSLDIEAVRQIMDEHRKVADLHLGGVPMIASDSIDFIKRDLATFGLGVLVFMVLILTLIFWRLHWVLFPILTCLFTITITVGLLGYLDWPITIVSSNFISLLLIVTLSLNIHLIVRHREVHRQAPDADQAYLVRAAVGSKAAPCFYTAITTIVAFGSLIMSGIRPIIDFGWMMSIGILIAFVTVFLMLPALLMLIQPGNAPKTHDLTKKVTNFVAGAIKFGAVPFSLASAVIAVTSVVGILFLTVDNRFIDYYKKSTEIYQGMELIDQRLGGTTPLDVIIDRPPIPESEAAEIYEDDLSEDDPYYGGFYDDTENAGFATTSYWYNADQLRKIGKIHDYLDALPETGKVLSLASGFRVLDTVDPNLASDNFQLSILFATLTEPLKQVLFWPYISEEGDQIRFAIRVFESDASLQRTELITKIKEDLVSEFDLNEDQVNLSGMLVLYNNMLQSLFRSQILTLGVVFAAIMVMFAVLFRNLKMAALAIVPNIFAACLVLGLMGWLSIPLDLMTITIAAISIGIAVDDTIHYVHRFTEEYAVDGNYWAAVERSHDTIGRAMYYTTLTITLGFSILALSNFVPTIYFGLLTGLAMVVALAADLIILPLLIVTFKPLGRGTAIPTSRTQSAV